MAKIIIIKNTTGSGINVAGEYINAGDQTQIVSRLQVWRDSSTAASLITSGDLVVNNGSEDLNALLGLKYLNADFPISLDDNSEVRDNSVFFNFVGNVSVVDAGNNTSNIVIGGGSSFAAYSDVMEFGNAGTVGNQFLDSAGSHHTSKDSCPLALANGEVVHVTISTEKYPERVWDLQIITNAVKDGVGTYAGGTQIGTNLTKPASQLDIVYTNLTGFNFSAGDRIQTYALKNPDDAVEPLVRVFVRYD